MKRITDLTTNNGVCRTVPATLYIKCPFVVPLYRKNLCQIFKVLFGPARSIRWCVRGKIIMTLQGLCYKQWPAKNYSNVIRRRKSGQDLFVPSSWLRGRLMVVLGAWIPNEENLSEQNIEWSIVIKIYLYLDIGKLMKK